MDVWPRVRRQYIMGFGGPVAINQMAVWRMIDERSIRNRMECFTRVCMAADIEIEAIHDEQDEGTGK